MAELISLLSVRNPTIAIAATATNTSVSLPGQGGTIRLTNEGPNNCYVSVGPGPQVATVPGATATITSTAILAGTDLSFSIPRGTVLCIGTICRATQTATLLVQVGEGS